MITIKVSKATADQAGLNPIKHRQAIETARGIAAAAALQSLQSATSAWTHPPVFTIATQDDATTVTTEHAVFFYQDQGTKPHVIRPRTKRALAWPGGAHPVKRVNHPGTTAMHYTARANAVAQSVLRDETTRQIALVRGGGVRGAARAVWEWAARQIARVRGGG